VQNIIIHLLKIFLISIIFVVTRLSQIQHQDTTRVTHQDTTRVTHQDTTRVTHQDTTRVTQSDRKVLCFEIDFTSVAHLQSNKLQTKANK